MENINIKKKGKTFLGFLAAFNELIKQPWGKPTSAQVGVVSPATKPFNQERG